MKANPDKRHFLVTTNASTSVINGFQITNRTQEKLLIIKFDSKLSFENHVSSLCIKASENWIVNYMNLSKRKALMKTFVISQFNYCPLVWMFHSRKLNHRINSINERALRVTFQDYKFTFFQLLQKDNSIT